MLSGCIIEEDISYDGNDIIDKVMESQQDCADYCKTILGGNFWTWNSGDKRCWVKTTSAGWRTRGGRVSGNRVCGSGKKCVPMCSYVLAIYVSNQFLINQHVPPCRPLLANLVTSPLLEPRIATTPATTAAAEDAFPALSSPAFWMSRLVTPLGKRRYVL